MKNWIFLSFLALFLVQCSGKWSEKTCSETSFMDVGYEDGSLGKTNKVDAYNQACLKKKVQISVSDYNSGYQKGLKVYCSKEKAYNAGSKGQKPLPVCNTVSTYQQKHQEGLKSFCSSKRGVEDGFGLKPKNSLCTPFSSYSIGYTQGKKDYCSFERGAEVGFEGKQMDAKCAGYSIYEKGYKSGKAKFCSPENGERLGIRGSSLPEQCRSSRAFVTSYNKGRVRYLNQALEDKKIKLTFERQSYERLRDDLQDTQFALSRLPKNSILESVNSEKDQLNKQLIELRKKRDQQREAIEKMESEMVNIKEEIQELER